ncbi:MAG: hypothetical protein ABW215_21470 [Kibdelosporangium sp.]
MNDFATDLLVMDDVLDRIVFEQETQLAGHPVTRRTADDTDH